MFAKYVICGFRMVILNAWQDLSILLSLKAKQTYNLLLLDQISTLENSFMKWGRMYDNRFLQEQFVDIFNSIECKFDDNAHLTHIPTSQTSIVDS